MRINKRNQTVVLTAIEAVHISEYIKSMRKTNKQLTAQLKDAKSYIKELGYDYDY